MTDILTAEKLAERLSNMAQLSESASYVPFLGQAADMLKAQAAEIERLTRERDEAESAIWRVPPNTFTVPCEINGFTTPDEYEGVGETYHDACHRTLSRATAAEAKVAVLEKALNTPEVFDFVKAVQLEAAHQRARWGSDHDAGKTDADWFWLVGYLAGKALHNPPNDMHPAEAQLHRIVATAAALANWHAAKLGLTNMRPGIEPPIDAALGAKP